MTSNVLHKVNSDQAPLCFLVLSDNLGVFLSVFLVIIMGLNATNTTCTAIVSRTISTILYFVIVFHGRSVLQAAHRSCCYSFRRVHQVLSIKVPVTLGCSVATVKAVVLRDTIGIFNSDIMTTFATTSGIDGVTARAVPALNATVTACYKRGLNTKGRSHVFHNVGSTFCLYFFTTKTTTLLYYLTKPAVIK